jgi:hypothetical protein
VCIWCIIVSIIVIHVTYDIVLQVSASHNVVFGMRNGSFVTGYVPAAEIHDAHTHEGYDTREVAQQDGEGEGEEEVEEEVEEQVQKQKKQVQELGQKQVQEQGGVVSRGGSPFDFLVGGLGWLVRNGAPYVSESFSKQGDGEDMGAQSTGRCMLICTMYYKTHSKYSNSVFLTHFHTTFVYFIYLTTCFPFMLSRMTYEI